MDAPSTNSRISSTNPYHHQKKYAPPRLKTKVFRALVYAKKHWARQKTPPTSLISAHTIRQTSEEKQKISAAKGQIFDELDTKEPFDSIMLEYGDIKTISIKDFEKIVDYVKRHKDKLFSQALAKKQDSYYRRGGTGLPNAFQIHIPKGVKRADEMEIIIHLKPSLKTKGKKNVVELGEGSEKWFKLSLGFKLNERNIRYHATGTSIAASRRKNPLPLKSELDKAISRFDHEIQLLENFRGQRGVVQLITHSVYPIKGKIALKPNMVLEVADGDLHSLLAKLSSNPSDPLSQQWGNNPIRKKYVVDLLEGLTAVHKKNIINFDIKLENILLCKGSAKLADFGFAVVALGSHAAAKGSAGYLSPEILNFVMSSGIMDSYAEGTYYHKLAVSEVNKWGSLITKQTDVYSLGVCLYFLKYLKFPDYLYIENKQKSRNDILTLNGIDIHITHQKLWHSSFQPEDEEGKMIKAMMHPDPRQRLSASDALKLAKGFFPDIN